MKQIISFSGFGDLELASFVHKGGALRNFVLLVSWLIIFIC